MLPRQQHFEGHVLLKFDFLAYFVDFIGLWCLGLSISVTLNIILLRNMMSQIFLNRPVTSLMTSYREI